VTTARPSIPILDLTAEIESLWDELQEAFVRVMGSGHFILGPEVSAFEREVSEYLGAKHAIGVNSGTDALVISLRALDIGPGDEVITTPFTFFATAEAISSVGASPVFVDIDPATFNIDPQLIRAAITPRTKAILPVHLFGLAAEMDAIRSIADEHGLRVIEDVAQAFGGRYKGQMLGTLGDVAAFSFFPSKNLGAFGDAGVIVSNDENIAQAARMLRTHGSMKKNESETLGYNSRLDELQAAILRVKLPHVDAWNQQRRQVAERYRIGLEQSPGIVRPIVTDYTDHVYHQYTIRVVGQDRDALRQQLSEAGITTMVYYPIPLHKQAVYAEQRHSFPCAERSAKEVLSLPMWPQLAEGTQAEVLQNLVSMCK
jgi:dTDP-4-amino-4,6-dideoxygalactose transaminase